MSISILQMSTPKLWRLYKRRLKRYWHYKSMGSRNQRITHLDGTMHWDFECAEEYRSFCEEISREMGRRGRPLP